MRCAREVTRFRKLYATQRREIHVYISNGNSVNTITRSFIYSVYFAVAVVIGLITNVLFTFISNTFHLHIYIYIYIAQSS